MTTKDYYIETKDNPNSYILQVIENKGFRLLIANKEKKEEEAFSLIDAPYLLEQNFFAVYTGCLDQIDCYSTKNDVESNHTWSKYEINKQNLDCDHFWVQNESDKIIVCNNCKMKLEDYNKISKSKQKK